MDRELGEIRVVADSPDGLVRAAVGGRGELLDLELDPRLYRDPDSRALATAIVATVRCGVELAAVEAVAILKRTLRAAADGPVAHAYLDQFDRRLDAELK